MIVLLSYVFQVLGVLKDSQILKEGAPSRIFIQSVFCRISGLHCSVVVFFALLGCYRLAADHRHFGTAFASHLEGSSSHDH